MTPEEIGTLVGAAIAVLTGAGGITLAAVQQLKALRKELAANSKDTGEAKDAAKDAANHAAERVRLMRDLQDALQENYYLRRTVDAMEIEPACQGCRAAIARRVDELRRRPSAPLPKEPAP